MAIPSAAIVAVINRVMMFIRQAWSWAYYYSVIGIAESALVIKGVDGDCFDLQCRW